MLTINIRRRLAVLITSAALTMSACYLPAPLAPPCLATWLIRQIDTANGDADTDTIDLAPGCIYEFDEINNSDSSGDGNALPTIITPIEIHGNGATLRRSAAAGTPEFRFFYVDRGGSPSLDDMTITNGGYEYELDEFPPWAGAIFNWGSLSAFNVTFSDNQSEQGGAIVNVGAAEITDSEFTGNQANLAGAISSEGTLTIVNSIFSNNQVVGGGGAISNGPAGIVNITLSEFTGNEAGTSDGAIRNLSGTLTIGSSIFSNNQGRHGGAIRTSGPTEITGGEFTGNQAANHGGAIINVASGIVTITLSEFTGNHSSDAGGVISNWGEITITDSAFTNNLTVGSGGVIFNDGSSSLSAENSAFSENIAALGGAIYNSSGEIYIIGATLTDNQATKWGGALGIHQGEMLVVGSTISGNHAEKTGGAIITSSESTLTIESSTIENNTAKAGSAGIASFGQLSITNSTISGNRLLQEVESSPGSAYASAISHNILYPLTIRFTTITNNSGSIPVPAIFAGVVTEIMNSIVADNPGGDCVNPLGDTISTSEANLDSDGSCGFTLTVDPQLFPLADNGGSTLTHALESSSAAINAATAACLATDQRGEPRPYPTGGECDIGAYEYSPVEDLEEPGPPIGTPTPTLTPLSATATLTALPPTATSTPTSTPLTPTATNTVLPPGAINGLVWKDSNNDGIQQDSEASYEGVTVLLGQGACTSSGYRSTMTDSLGGFFFQDLPAGTYCVFPEITPICQAYSIASTPSEQTVILAPGQSISIPFGYALNIC